jgi:hypothetical protein
MVMEDLSVETSPLRHKKGYGKVMPFIAKAKSSGTLIVNATK